jgi:hypothetical protein
VPGRASDRPTPTELRGRRLTQALPSPGLVRQKSRFIVANISFVLNYTKTEASPPATAIEFEKSFQTMDDALKFCVQLTELGEKRSTSSS